MNKLKNKYALVTGASTGIGRAVAIELGKQGWTVLLVARRMSGLEKTRDFVEKSGGKGIVMGTDLTKLEEIDHIVDLVSTEATQLDLIVNVAGIWHGKDEVYAGKNITDFDWKIIENTYKVGIIVPTIIASGLTNLMPKGASIINISGTFENGAKGWLPYYVSKRAIEDFTVGLSEELKDKGIKVNCVSPSDTATEEYIKYFPEEAKNANKPEDIAKKVIELISVEQTGRTVIVRQGSEIKEGFHK